MPRLVDVAQRAWGGWRQVRRWLRQGLRVVWWIGFRLAGTALLAGLLGDGATVDPSLSGRTTALARPYLFDYVRWDVDALWSKLKQELLSTHLYLDDDTRRQVVLDYLDRVGQVQEIEARIERIYADPAVTDPAAASASWRAERDALRRSLESDQALAEAILEDQVSAVLADAGFGLLGQVLPPVAMHFTELPVALIVSPRDRIEFEFNIDLVPMTVEERAALEDHIDSELDVSSLVVPLGGLSLYPSMITETPRITRAIEVTAHEWTHHYLVFFPLGWDYYDQPETRIINETVATFVGREIAREVLARYYPDEPLPDYPTFLADPVSSSAAVAGTGDPPYDPDSPEPFNFYRELDRTRRQVDFLLWQGKIEAAETYMEYRRREFVRHRYGIRKLNQAYFAFYGGYQGAPGAGGADPIGPAIEELRLLSPDMKAWLDTLRGITTRDGLLAALEDARATARADARTQANADAHSGSP